MMTDLPGLSQQIELFEARLLADPDSRAYLPLADLYRRAGKLQEAHQILVRGLTRDNTCLSARVLFGLVLTDLDQHQSARVEFQTVLDHDPNNILALRMLGQDAAAQGDWLQACGLLERLLRLLPEDFDLRNALQESRKRIAAENGALTTPGMTPALQKRLPRQLDPNHQQLLPDQRTADDRLPAATGVETPTLAELYWRQGHPDKARQIIESILAISPGHLDALALLARMEQDASTLASSSESEKSESGPAEPLPGSEDHRQARPLAVSKRGDDLQRFRRWIESGNGPG